MKKFIKKNLKKDSKVQNISFPAVIPIMIILFICIILAIYYIYLRFVPKMIFPYDGYAISGKEISENLLSTKFDGENIKALKINGQDMIFKKAKSYYIGEDKKNSINTNYPIYINNNIALFNLSQDSKLITKDFEEVECYPNFTLVSGVIYNMDDLTRADMNEYLFLKNQDRIYINSKEINIKTSTKEYTIPINSMIYFAEEYITFYRIEGEFFVYDKILDIDYGSNVIMDKNELTYKELLVKLGIINNQEEKGESQEVEEQIIEEKKEEKVEKQEDNEKVEEQEEKIEESEKKYIKPEVNCTDFITNVYSTRTNLNIYDPSGEIVSPVTFTFLSGEKIYLRKSVITSGDLEILGLMPNEKYKITGTYTYLTEDGKKMQKTFFEQEIQTKGIETLNPISISFGNGKIYSNKIEIKDLKIESNLSDEAIKGVKKAEIVIDNSTYKMSIEKLVELLKGDSISYETPEGLKSNSKIEYKIFFYDIAGNELKIENNVGETRTSKKSPTVTIKTEKQDITEVVLNVDLNNKDNVNINNYRYIIYDASGKIVIEDKLDINQQKIVLNNLDPNQYFKIQIYGDFDIEDGEGLKINQEIGNGNFTSVPLSILGYLNMNTEIKELRTSEAEINLSINEERTDSRLIQILKSLSISIREKDSENIVQTITIEDEIQKLKNNEEIQITFTNLKSSTEYEVDMTSIVKQGNTQETINVIYSLKSFITMKKSAEVQIRNQFVTGEMIDFDVRIEDIDNSVLNNKVRLEIRDEDNKLIKMESIATNREYIRLTYEKLNEKTNYQLSFYANEYNEGSDDSTYKSNFLIKQLNIFTEPGISGNVRLTNLLRIGSGKNLVDVKSEVKWYSPCWNIWNYYGKTYDEKENTLKLYAGKSKSSQYYTYDLREYVGKTVTISFYAKIYEDGGDIQAYLQNSKTGANRKLIEGISKNEWKQCTYTVQVDNSGYLGFLVVSADYHAEGSSLLIKDLQIEESSIKTRYEEYKYNLEANFNINLQDLRNEITTNDYYLKIYKNNVLLSEERYEELNENHLVENALKKYNLEEGNNYRVELVVKIREREYVIDHTSFNTKEGEILGISTKEEFRNIQPNGNYVVVNDIDLSGVTGSSYRFGSDKFGFAGRLDFQGHTLKRDFKTAAGIFYRTEKTAIIENLVFEVSLNNTIETANFRGLVDSNGGTIRNIIVKLTESNPLANISIALVGYSNWGIFENFVINLEKPIYGARQLSSAFITSSGIIRNGYIYGENIKATFSIGAGQWRDTAGLIYQLDRGTIENVYSLVNVNYNEQSDANEYTANIVERNYRGTVKNVYSVGIGDFTRLSNGPNVSRNESGKIYDSYYFCDQIFTNSYNKKTTSLALYDAQFQNQILNSQNQFIVDDLIEQKYYPQVKLSDVMPNQDFIKLPEVEDADLIDILSLEILKETENIITVRLSVNNPSGEQITNLKVKDLTARIVSQEYNDGKSNVIVELSNPIKYVSKYSVMSITSKGAFNIPYTREFQDNERTLYIDFYKEVNSISEWKEINKSTTENYKLMADLDFINEDTSILITNTYTGKIDGNNHTIKNITIPEKYNGGLFNNLNGEIKNLNIENYTQITNSSSRVGIILVASQNAVIDNVHAKNIKLGNVTTGATEIGGIVANSNSSIIRNSSITNLEINMNSNILSCIAGGIVGSGSNVRITNSFAQNIDFNIHHALIYNGIGGIIGRDTDNGGRVQYCYVTGNISTDAEKTGGIYGYTNAKVSNNYCLVNIDSQTDFLGGIGGYDNNTSTGNSSYNLYLGNLYSTKTSTYINRIIGNVDTEVNNYAYNNQKINGFITQEEKGAELVTKQDIFDSKLYKSIMYFENEFNYDELEKGILPKLYNEEGTALLPNQQDNKIEDIVLNIDEVDSNKSDVNTVMVRVVVNNPNKVEITNVNIQYMDAKIIKNAYDNGKTYIDLVATPLRYYDSYKITCIKCIENEKEIEVSQEAKIDVQFYKEIANFEDWQAIDSESAQNYRLVADLDFKDKINPNTNVSIGRLEAEGEGHTIKNLNITLNQQISGFIKEIKNSLKNITFENISITNTASGERTGLVLVNIGVIENVNFNNIIIDAKKMNQVGIISRSLSIETNNINLENIYCYGKDYMGGFVANTDSGVFSDITGNNINITSTGSRVGGIFGIVNGRTPYLISNVTVQNSNVSGNDYVGALFGSGRGNNFTSINNNVTGRQYVGGVIGWQDGSWEDSQSRFYTVRNVHVIGTGNFIGGIAGQIHRLIDGYVFDSTIEATTTTSSYLGGVAGRISWAATYVGVLNSTIISKGSHVGGVVGYADGGGQTISRCYAYNSTVEGYAYVGGFIGTYRQGQIAYCYNNSVVTATGHSAGGLIGWLNNKDMTGANYTSRLTGNYILGAIVTAPSKVGGLIGNITTELYHERYYNKNYVEAYVNATNSKLVSLGIGSDQNQNTKLTDTYLYKYSTINGEYVNEINDTFKEKSYLTSSQLKQKNTYTGIMKWDANYMNYTPINNGKYPYAQGARNQVEIDIPEDPVINTQSRMLMLSRSIQNATNEELPNMKIYTVSVNEINIEFDKINTGAYFVCKIGDEVLNLNIDKNIYTFEYDFRTPIEITISNIIKTKEENINPEDISKKLSIVDNEYFYISGGKLYSNNRSIDGNFANLYKEQVLSEDGYIYNLKTLEKESTNKTKCLELNESSKPLVIYDYENSIIKTYGGFSTITTGDKTTQRDQRIFIKNGKMSILDGNLQMVEDSVIIDNYGGKEYQTILGTDGIIYDLKESIKYPNDFINKKIKEITNNIDSENKIISVLYEDGKVYVFNYITGEKIYDNEVKADTSLIDYIKEQINVKEKLVENIEDSYKESKKLEEKLQETPIVKAIDIINSSTTDNNTVNNIQNITNTSTATNANSYKYTTVYDTSAKKFVVYNEEEILDVEKEEVTSETFKIESQIQLSTYYYSGANIHKTKESNGIVWIVLVIVATIISLGILYKRKNL